MKKTLHFSLLLVSIFIFSQSKSQQSLYQNNNLGNRIYNPGLGAGDTAKVIFDDINIPSADAGTADSVVISQVQVAIGRLPGSPAVKLNMYATATNPAYSGLKSLPAVPPKLIGTLNLPAGGNSSFFTIGNNITPLAAFKLDTGRFLQGYETIYIGLSFSDSISSHIGWYLSSGPDTNYDLIYKYDVTRTDSPVVALNLAGTYNLPATFYAVVNGTFKNAIILPVVLSSFKVSHQGNFNLLQWITQSENNAGEFMVERSSDGQNFKAIGKIAAKGFSTLATSYQFIDKAPLFGVNYYRLQMADKDNKTTYSDIKSVANQLSNALSIYPNPLVTKTFTAQFTSAAQGIATIKISNAGGQLIYTKTVNMLQGNNMVSISADLPSGVYYITINGNGTNYSGRFVKE